MNTDAEVLKAIAEHLGLTSDEIDRNANLRDDLNLGPLELNDLLESLQKKFQISLDPADLADVQTVNDIIVLVEDNLLEWMNIEQLLKKLNLKFRSQKILEQIFIHRSYLNEVKLKSPSNERLEFLGDAVLSLIISFELFNKRPLDAEGDLTNLRAHIVKTKSLAEAAKKINLGSFLLLSKGEELGGGRENPQILANTYEALIGAIFLDQGMEKVQEIIKKTLLPLFEKEVKLGPPKDAKSKLQEIVQEKFRVSPYYKTLKTFGPDHAKMFLVAVHVNGKQLGQGKGYSKQEAEEKAAKVALEKMTNE